MSTMTSQRFRITAVFAVLAVVGSLAAYSVATASAQGRTIEGAFCLSAAPFCMQATFDGQQVQGYAVNSGGTCSPTTTGTANCAPSGTGYLALRPGTYWIHVVDNHNSHNFELRSCPGFETACIDGKGTETQLTPICNSSGSDTPCGGATTSDVIPNMIKINLKHGWYRLFCDTQGTPQSHEDAGMYIDFEVGGVGQVG
jgi:hypothetical protein